MNAQIGYLLPTRERIMRGEHETAPLLRLAEKAETLGFDSVWVGDSLLARPRHEPLTLLAAVSGRTQKVKLGTAVLVVPMRNPVLLAHQIATLDQVSDGRVLLGVGAGIDAPNVMAEFESAGAPWDKRFGTMLEAVRLMRKLWTGEAVDWDGRWKVSGGRLAPLPVQPGGPPMWGGGSAPASLTRAARHFDGWFPTGPADPVVWGEKWASVKEQARAAGRNADAMTGALYLTLSVADNAGKAEENLMAYLNNYYGALGPKMRAGEACYAGPPEGTGQWLRGFIDAGARHLVLRFAGDHERQMETVSRMRRDMGF
jgi:alkanesulfonate monooxygenase SsuD/methylene tetrahydromethanopterin reductase-like flavin-dependent oxidoreductase (luciferase family)